MDPALWALNKFEDFLSARREIIQKKLNEFMASLITEPEKTRDRSIHDLIGLGESKTLEFKSTLQWDVVQNQQNTHLRLSVIKTVAAFLNSDGGTLIIGVDDTGTPYGLENDLRLLSGSLDKFSQLLSSLLADHIGPQYAHLVKSRFEEIDNMSVCVLDVENAPEPVFVNGAKGKEFFVRVGNTTRALDPQQTMQYVEMNWS
jgi:predicted HTH transcriptional regulator